MTDRVATAGKRNSPASLETQDLSSRNWTVIGILFLVFFLGLSDNQMMSPLLPLIASEFGIEPGEVGKQIGPAYSIAAAFTALIVGPASDRQGRRRFLLWAAAVFGLSLVSVVVVTRIEVLAVVRFITGMSAGVFSTCSIAYVGDFFPYEKRGTAMSIVQSGYFASLIVGVPVGSFLGETQGWRSAFILFGVLSFAAFASIAAGLPKDRMAHAQRAAGEGEARRFADIRNAFASVDRAAAIVAAFFVSGGFMGFILYLGSWLQTIGVRPGRVGMVFILVGVASLLGALAAGPIADRLGKKLIALISTLVLAVGLLLIPRLDWSIELFVALTAASLAFAFRQGPLHALVTEIVPRRSRGALVALRNTASQIGIAASAVACGYLYDNHGYTSVGTFSALMTAGAAACILLLKEPLAKAESN